MNNINFCKLGLAVIETEAQAILTLTHRINHTFALACSLLLACKGRVIVTGIGKSGHIGRKVAATLSSTGTPAFFMHPGEASHGDLGMITPSDTVLAISNSGFTNEIITLLPILKRLCVPLITLTGNKQSTIAQAADINIDISVTQEACPLGLAPTASTTAALVMGDALAIALLQVRGFSAEDFALNHPGGQLGRRLLLRIDDIWHANEQLPVVYEHITVREALIEVTSKKLGMTCVINAHGYLVGVYTDGDIRRTLTQNLDIYVTPLCSVMTQDCKTIKAGLLAAEALSLMHQYCITSLVVVNDNHHPIAVLHLHDLLQAGVF